MTFDDYQSFCRTTAIYTDTLYPVLGLAEEAGEVAGKYAKWVRDGGAFPEETIIKELGDVLWMVAAIASDLDVSLDTVASMNKMKLESRAARGVLSGSGDNR